MASTAPPISKLCLVDNVILFCKAKTSELFTLKKCLEKYCSWSGQKISAEKAGFFPSKGVSNQFVNQIKHSWGLKYVKDKLEGKLSCWKSKNLSMAGRATLIKSVAQSIPTYTMAGLQVISLMQWSVGFGGTPKRNKVHFGLLLLGLCYVGPKRKKVWILGIFGFNQALISKLAW